MTKDNHSKCRKARINGEPYTLLCDHREDIKINPMTKCKCLCHKEVPSGTIRAFSHIEDCLRMTKWKEQFDKIFNSVVGVKHFHPEIEDEIKLFISNLIEQVIYEMPTDDDLNDAEYPWQGINKLKQKLRDKYLN